MAPAHGSSIPRGATSRRSSLPSRTAAAACLIASLAACVSTDAERVARTVRSDGPVAGNGVITDMPPLPDTLWAGNARVRDVLSPATDFTRAMLFERMAGGAGTARGALDRNAYSHHVTTLSFEELQRFKLGNALFNEL